MKRKGARLGQHFLTGQWAARALARAAGITSGDTIIEIGPGKGALTKELLGLGAHVIAIEKDPTFHEGLTKSFMEYRSSLELIRSDIRDIDLQTLPIPEGKYVVAANIPYYITGEIIRKFLTSPLQPQTMALLVQKEVANRIISKKESILSLSVKAYGTPTLVAKVARGNFSPPPSVDSAILLISNISRSFFEDVEEPTFFKMVRAGFSSKRKLLMSNLNNIGFTKPYIIRRVFESCDLGENVRAEDVPIEKWKCLTKQLRAFSFQLPGARKI